ncbi:uncharacterized protein LOC118751107 [Rhagoletis pomonella]|uniref:uncharacterized protein LOC118751091 n=1 Tax=Rhagoletis pomonella TaxID=28610 RepID=UPI001780A982|nr:uncharacterized protein LOC118751091 [Rhagoletis pomonella]XP_036341768.1 uncharacterized protein LOC118751107 [Rhagoletis pomonella]
MDIRESNPAASTIVSACKRIFSRQGIPSVVVGDSGTQFNSREFLKFARNWGMKVTLSSPHHHQGNGKAESAVKIVKRIFRRADKSGQDHKPAPEPRSPKRGESTTQIKSPSTSSQVAAQTKSPSTSSQGAQSSLTSSHGASQIGMASQLDLPKGTEDLPKETDGAKTPTAPGRYPKRDRKPPKRLEAYC